MCGERNMNTVITALIYHVYADKVLFVSVNAAEDG